MCYPGLRGRLSTCYSPVRRSGVPKDLTARLACLKRAASVRSEPGSNSPLSKVREQVPAYFFFKLVYPVILARTGFFIFPFDLFELTEASGFFLFSLFPIAYLFEKSARNFLRALLT